MDPGWDDPALREFAERLVRRREPRLTDPGPRGADAVEWFLGQVEPAVKAQETIRARFEPPTGDIPGSVKIGMSDCQKPFHLWNVNRIEDKPGTFVKEPPYTLGAAAAIEREGLPGKVVPASRLAERAREDASLTVADAFGAGRRLKNMLSEDAASQGLGVADE
jgi:hypothetical protein